MNRFSYAKTESLAEAVKLGAEPATRFLAGGTNLVDLMKANVERPARLVDISHLPYVDIEDQPNGGLLIGAMAANAETAYDPRVEKRYPLLSSAILAGASAQLRNAATNGGNLNQRTRCYYFYDTATPCNKREPGSGCSAIGGVNRIHAILGASKSCIATHPSDMCVALAALEAMVHVTGPNGERQIAFADYHRLPGDDPSQDNTLQPGEIVTGIELPAEGYAQNHTYLKLRDRLSYAFALVSVAAGLKMEGDTISQARLALGGVAHKPWRVPEAEALLRGQSLSPQLAERVADAILENAVGQGANDFKIGLAKRAIRRALRQAAAGTPQVQSHKQLV